MWREKPKFLTHCQLTDAIEEVVSQEFGEKYCFVKKEAGDCYPADLEETLEN